ncbi:RNA polymerase sigma-70 factor (ECF subfamily) [Marinimicrobium koreense]|uniref:RNA polymerase sigma-70 factor (ECF subfamily) n=1 Tax=Marinimicrobium koreense TaxID=306545 RepID=A0A3N1P1F4_9GAMM|nr:RNA polymerase factor sigma-70 [Marinimicrobium koreense]ROQ21428.1 RNA polymerase sigma-70 factor (ECF subfamily) [Marinimicrobium koreense]
MSLPQESREFFNDDRYLMELRRQMLRFAQLQLSDRSAAEDAVQEALAGALKNARSFAGASAFKTWVFAILKHKITDHFRRQKRLVTESSLMREDEESDEVGELFNDKGFWHAEDRPNAWRDPDAALEDRHFWKVFETCLEHLPAKQARVFMMREFIGLTTDEICEAVSLTVSNLHVLLHRARLRLRACLEHHWFNRSQPL